MGGLERGRPFKEKAMPLYRVIREHHNNQLKRNLALGNVVEMSKEQAELAPGLVEEAKSTDRPTPTLDEMKKHILKKKAVAELDLQGLSESQVRELYERVKG